MGLCSCQAIPPTRFLSEAPPEPARGEGGCAGEWAAAHGVHLSARQAEGGFVTEGQDSDMNLDLHIK